MPDPVEEAVEAGVAQGLDREALKAAWTAGMEADGEYAPAGASRGLVEAAITAYLDSLASAPEGKAYLLSRALSEEERETLRWAVFVADSSCGKNPEDSTKKALALLRALLSPGVEE